MRFTAWSLPVDAKVSAAFRRNWRSALDEISINRTFVHVAEMGSLSAAARGLNLSITSVARQISSLESSLGVRLLNRTTRRQSLTDAGQDYYFKINEILAQMNAIKLDMASYEQGVRGTLRVHLSSSIGNQLIVPALPRFLESYPELSVEVTLTDERADLVKWGVDVAVWIGELKDSSFITRRLDACRRLLCASPAFIERFGHPEKPADLQDLNCLVFTAPSYGSPWRFTRDGTSQDVEVSGNLRTDSPAALLTGALHGAGLAILQKTMVNDAIAKERLVHVLPAYEASPTSLDVGLFVVYPSARQLTRKTRALVDFLVELFQHYH